MAPGSHLEDGDLREVLLLEVGVCDELQLGLKEAVERLQEKHNINALILKAGSLLSRVTCHSLAHLSIKGIFFLLAKTSEQL